MKLFLIHVSAEARVFNAEIYMSQKLPRSTA